MRKKLLFILAFLPTLLFGQINTERVLIKGRVALYFEEYILAIQYFNQVINAKPYLHMPYFYRSIAKLELDDFTGVEEDATQLLNINPFFVSGYQIRGLSRIQQGKFADAILDYKQGLKYEPENLPILNNLALSYINSELFDDAETTLSELLRVSPKYTMAYLMKADVALRKKDTIQAMGYVDEALAIDKYDSNIWATRGQLHLAQKKYKEAEDDFDEATSLGGHDAGHYVNRALARFHQNNLRGAMTDYDLALDIDSRNFYGHYNRGLLRARIGDYNRAVEDFDFVLDVDPDDIMATFNRGILRSRTGDYAGVIQDMSRVIDVYPKFEPAYHYRLEARKITGDKIGAEQDEITLLKSQIARDNNKNSNQDKGEETRKRSDKNVENYRKLVVADKNDISRNYSNALRGKVQNKVVQVKSEPYFVLTYYTRMSEVRNVIHYHKYIDDINSSRVLPYPLLITNQEKALNQDEANRHFKLVDEESSSIEKDPNNALHRFARGLDFFLVQSIDDALTDFTQAILLDSKFFPAYFMRALVRIKQLEYEKSEGAMIGENTRKSVVDYEVVMSDLNNTIELAPDFAYAYYNRGRLYFDIKDYSAALADYTKAINLYGDFAEAYFNRGLIYIFLGNNAAGISDLSKAGELGLANSYNIIKRFRKSE